MKRRLSFVLAILLGLVGSATIFGIAILIVLATAFFEAMNGLGCQQNCSGSGFKLVIGITEGVGVAAAIVAFWGIFQGLRPMRKPHPKLKK